MGRPIPPTPRQQLRQTATERERRLKVADRERLRALRAAVRDAKRLRTDRVRQVRAQCREEKRRQILRDKQAREDLRESIRRMRREAKKLCQVQLDDARELTGMKIADAVDRLSTEAQHQRQLRAWSRTPKSCPVRLTPGEKRQESDCEVESNIDDPGLRAVFQRVKSKIKASPRMSRTEAFLQWVHDHSADVAEIQFAAEEEAIKELERQEKELARELAASRTRKTSSKQFAPGDRVYSGRVMDSKQWGTIESIARNGRTATVLYDRAVGTLGRRFPAPIAKLKHLTPEQEARHAPVPF